MCLSLLLVVFCPVIGGGLVLRVMVSCGGICSDMGVLCYVDWGVFFCYWGRVRFCGVFVCLYKWRFPLGFWIPIVLYRYHMSAGLVGWKKCILSFYCRFPGALVTFFFIDYRGYHSTAVLYRTVTCKSSHGNLKKTHSNPVQSLLAL